MKLIPSSQLPNSPVEMTMSGRFVFSATDSTHSVNIELLWQEEEFDIPAVIVFPEPGGPWSNMVRPLPLRVLSSLARSGN